MQMKKQCNMAAWLRGWILLVVVCPWWSWANIGNAWHSPWDAQPGLDWMREPVFAYYPEHGLRLYTGNQFQGSGGTPGAQIEAGSAVFYRIQGTGPWLSAPLTFHSSSGNDELFVATLPPNLGVAGQTVEYYFRIAYLDRDTTYVHVSSVNESATTREESTARSSPFRILIHRTPPPAHPSPADWRDMNIYQIFTDRFYDGDPSNNTLSPSAFNPTHPTRVHGGDFRGIEKKLDYIKALGANAIWISPIVLNVGNGSYHGYHAYDFYTLAPHWGTMDDLRSMVASAHARGIYVLLDIVCNHGGNLIGSSDPAFNTTFSLEGYPLRWNNTNVRYPPPFHRLSHYHNHGTIGGQWFDPPQILGEFPGGLDDLRTSSDYVRRHMVEIYRFWMEQGNFDGFRIDTVKHVELGFWQHFNPAIRAHAAAYGKTNFFQLGEVYDGGQAKLGSYTGTQAGGAYANDSVFDFSLYFRVNSIFAQANGNTAQIEEHYQGVAQHYHPDAQMRLVTFIDNHDVHRFMHSQNANNNTGRLHVATSFLYTSRGIPSLYYGTEQNFNGGEDPQNRENMFDGQFPSGGPSTGDRFNMTEPTFLHIAQLNNFRRLYPSLRRGAHLNRWATHNGPGLFAYARVLEGEEILVVFNTASDSRTMDARPTSYASGTVLVNLFNPVETITVGSSGIPPITVPGTDAKMFIAQSRWQPLDPVVVRQQPAHAATGVSATGSLQFEFSKPMDAASVEAAFEIRPHRSGSFVWSADQRTLTFTPHGPGFAAFTRYDVRIDSGALDEVDGLSMHGGFETFLVTGDNVFVDVEAPSVVIVHPSAGEVLSGFMTVSGTASDNVAVSEVQLRVGDGAWITATGTDSWSGDLDTRWLRNGNQAVGVRAFDGAGNVSEIVEVEVRLFNVPSAYEARISAGNPSTVIDCEGRTWLADQAYTMGSFGYVGGTAGNIANSIVGICGEAQSLYQRERYGANGSAFSYRFDCPPGEYEITLLQAENWVSGPNQRLFDVRIQDETVVENKDIFALAGGQAIPLNMVYTLPVEEGPLWIHFEPKVQNPRVAGISVRRLGDLDTSGDGLPDWWMLGHFDTVVGGAADLTRAEDDYDGDGMTNWQEFIAGTSPRDPESVLRLRGMGSAGGLGFESVSGRRYRVQSSTSLIQPNWIQIGDPLVGAGGMVEFHAVDLDQQNYFRVQAEQP
ncbi:MAG TPA: alpha-amylase family glycosyl hydrolase [Kiritimatiellia bacterium]|nr:alpha-amylase family glycosyl hydrolase [Kiritimatiellia bacterium]